MTSDSGSTPPGKRTKTTEITDLPEPSAGDANVKGGGLIVPCVSPIPCVRPAVPCIKNQPRSPIRGG